MKNEQKELVRRREQIGKAIEDLVKTREQLGRGIKDVVKELKDLESRDLSISYFASEALDARKELKELRAVAKEIDTRLEKIETWQKS